jgi:hypothetical protein
MANRRIADGFKQTMEKEAIENFINRCFTKVNVVSGYVSTNVCFGYAAIYCIEGYMYSAVAVTSGKYLPKGDGNSICASGKARMWAVCLDSVGSIHLYAGSAVNAGTSCFLGSVPTSVCPVGLVKVSCASNFSFTLGTMAWGSASLVSCTVQFWDISTIPQGVILTE